MFGNSWGNLYISCLLLIITLYFTCGERKNWWNIQKFQNIMSMVVVSFPDSWANHYRNCFFQQDYICFSKTVNGFAKVLCSFFYHNYLSICKACRRRLSYYQTLFCKYLHLQYNVFVIYDESKAVSQRPSHDIVSKKLAEKWQWNNTHISVIPTKLLLCIFIEIILRRWCPRPCRFAAYAQNTPKMKPLRGVASDGFTTHSLLIWETCPLYDTI